MNDLNLSMDVTEELTTLHVGGSARAIDAPALDRRVREILVLRPQRLVIDLAGVTFIASTALALLAHLSRGVREGGGVVEVRSTPPRIAEVIRQARLDDLLPLVDAPAAAGS